MAWNTKTRHGARFVLAILLAASGGVLSTWAGEDAGAIGKTPIVQNPGAEELGKRSADVVDVDRSGHVDAFDLAWLVHSFGARVGEKAYDALVDFDRNGVVDGKDLAILAIHLRRPVEAPL